MIDEIEDRPLLKKVIGAIIAQLLLHRDTWRYRCDLVWFIKFMKHANRLSVVIEEGDRIKIQAQLIRIASISTSMLYTLEADETFLGDKNHE